MAMARAGVENHVPHYDMYGHQHHREPFKDKNHVLDKEINHPRWLKAPPKVRSRTELMQARKAARVPDASYDFDGDGAVGQLDYFIGRSFDKNCDGKLSGSERKRAQKALKAGFVEKHVRGLDSSGPTLRATTMQQRHGVILTSENPWDASKGFPEHFNSHVIPPHKTRTALTVSRLADLKASGASFGEQYAARVAPIDEPQPPDHRTDPRTCPISRISERAEADHQASRVRAGLLPTAAPVNPEREFKDVGMAYVEQPVMETRGQIAEARRQGMKLACEELRVKGEEAFIDGSVKQTLKELNAYEFRRPVDAVPMTATQLKNQRRIEKIEADQATFEHKASREFPRYSDEPEKPWWVRQRGPAERGPGGRAWSAPAARTMSEPTLKVTDVPWEPKKANKPASRPATAGMQPSKSHTSLGLKYNTRSWADDQIARGEGRNKPRLFDSIPPARVGPKDFEPLELHSSFECIRADAQRKLAAEERKNAGSTMRSALACDDWISGQFTSRSNVSSASKVPSQPDRLLRGAARPTTTASPAIDLDKLDMTHAPRSFGTRMALMRPTSNTGVRTGGFSTTLGVAEAAA